MVNPIDFGGHSSNVKVTMGIIDRFGVRGDATLCVVIFIELELCCFGGSFQLFIGSRPLLCMTVVLLSCVYIGHYCCKRLQNLYQSHELIFLCPKNGIEGNYTCRFGLSVCNCLFVCVKRNFNIGHNFWTIGDRSFIFGMHILLIKTL